MDFLNEEELQVYMKFKGQVVKNTTAYDDQSQPSVLKYSNMLIGKPTQIKMDHPQLSSKLNVEQIQQRNLSPDPSRQKLEFFGLIENENRKQLPNSTKNSSPYVIRGDNESSQQKLDKKSYFENEYKQAVGSYTNVNKSNEAAPKPKVFVNRVNSTSKYGTPSKQKILKRNQKPISSDSKQEYNQKLYNNLEKLVQLKSIDNNFLLKMIHKHMTECSCFSKEIQFTLKQEVKSLNKKY